MSAARCESCGKVVKDWLVAMTPWQLSDTDSFDASDEELLAGGARRLCYPCANREEEAAQ